MEKQDAAEYLGVSTRTLERLVASGRLKRGRALRKTRPVAVFEEKELERLKRELDSGRPPEVFGRPNTPKPKDAIGFRLDPFYIKLLGEEGEKKGLSPSEYARKLVIQGLEEPSTEKVFAEVESLRKSLSEMFFLMLVSKLGATDHEAEEIVKSISGRA